jgi:hypothetical protein
MSWRGRGYGGPFHLGRLPQSQKPFILYPDDDIVLSDLPNILFEIDSKKQEVVQQKFLVRKEVRFTEFWKSSPYYLQENSVENDIEKAFQNERFSDRFRLKSSKKNRLSDCLELKKSNFTQELLVGMKRKGRKKVKWDFKKGGGIECLRIGRKTKNFLNYHLLMQREPVITEQNVIRCSFSER